MASDCSLCSRSEARPDCYIRFHDEERPACRPCWEQLLLDPRRILRELSDGSARAGRPSSAP